MSEAFSKDDLDFGPANLVAGARYYECAREAVLEAGFVLPAKLSVPCTLHELVDQEALKECPNRRPDFGPIWNLAFRWLPAGDFPSTPFRLRVARLPDPEKFSRDLEDLCRTYHGKRSHVEAYVRVGLTKEKAIKSFAEQYKSKGASPPRGAGAPIRNHETVLKYLVATRVLKGLIRAKGLSGQLVVMSPRHRRRVWSRLVADAIALTDEILGKPLLKTDHEWTRAEQVIEQELGQYEAEIKFLRQVFHDPNETEPLNLDLRIARQLGIEIIRESAQPPGVF
jgi:hypothetical protein